MRVHLAAAATAALALAAPAGAGVILDRAAESLATDPVYVDPAAQPKLTPAQERGLENEIAKRAGGPVYVAVLPAAARNESGGDASEALRTLADDLGRRGVYVIVTGGQFRAGATGGSGLDRGEAAKLATRAFDAHRGDGLDATLVDFVDRVGAAREDDGGGGGFPWWIVIVGGGIALLFVVRRGRRQRAAHAEFAEVKEAAREDLVALAGDVAALEEQVETNPRANRAYLSALDQYAAASGAFDRASTPEQLEPVAKALEEGRYEMAVARAALEGAPEPERRSPCFFDPRHGPSVRDVAWSPYGGAPREVPACAACAIRVEEGEEPESRQVLVGGRQTPYWAAGPMYGGYFGGFFPGLLLGEMLGGFGGYGSGGAPVVAGGDGDGDDDGGGIDLGGDFGGGGFGGGDFGGGGGDFGGGGGGDF